jgi:hypothetical protein
MVQLERGTGPTLQMLASIMGDLSANLQQWVECGLRMQEVATEGSILVRQLRSVLDKTPS